MPDVPGFSPVIAILAMARSSEAALDRTLKPLGLTVRKYGLLGHIRRTPSISFSELARRSGVTVQSAHSAVASLADVGLVVDSTAHAGTSSTLRITAAGHSVLEQVQHALLLLDAELTAKSPELTRALKEATLGELGD